MNVDPREPNALNVVELITQKRNGHRLADGDLEQLMQAYVRDEVPDYQLSALAMAIYFQGLDRTEVVALTRAMTRTGRTLTWTDEDRPVIDKHSTGGIGDKTSLVLVPLLATCSVLVPKLSGRGLGTTGGTLDKLESIPGLRVNQELTDFQQLVRDVGCAIVSASRELAPADKKLYALRDVTGTVDSLPLITASILSKKLAEGLDALVLDVKCGRGALMKHRDTAHALATSLVEVATKLGTPAVALLSDMNQPLGSMVGNACEVLEAVDVLRENQVGALRSLVLELGSELLLAAGCCESLATARQRLETQLASGAAYEKFVEMIHAQGGQWPCELPLAPATVLTPSQSGWVTGIDGEAIGRLVVGLGGGRQQVSDSIDHGVGAKLLVEPGEPVHPDRPWLQVFTRRELSPHEINAVQQALRVGPEPVPAGPIVLDRVTPQALKT